MRFQYAECPEGQEEVHEEVRLAASAVHRKDTPGPDVGSGGARDEDGNELEAGKRRRDSPGGDGKWSDEVEEDKDEERQLEVEVGPTLGLRFTAPIRDPDCVSEEEEQQPYPALAPVAFFCFKQTMRPRNWCLRVVCNPYPFTCRRPSSAR